MFARALIAYQSYAGGLNIVYDVESEERRNEVTDFVDRAIKTCVYAMDDLRNVVKIGFVPTGEKIVCFNQFCPKGREFFTVFDSDLDVEMVIDDYDEG